MDVEQPLIHLNAGHLRIQHHVRLEQVSITQQERVIVVMRFLNLILVPLEHCQDLHVFKLFQQVGNVHRVIVCLELCVGEEQISSITVVQMEVLYQVLHV